MIGSRKYPTERDKGQSWVMGPPAMIPGFSRIAVPSKRIGWSERPHKNYTTHL